MAAVRESAEHPLFRVLIVAALTGTALATGCSSHRAHVREAPGFTALELREGSIAVGGVALGPVGMADAAMSDRLARQARIRILEHCVACQVMPVERTSELFGPDRCAGILDALDRGGALDRAVLADLDTILVEARYLLVARVEDHRTWNHHESHEEKDETRDPPLTWKVDEYHASRRVVVHMRLYDLRSGTEALSALIPNTSGSKVEREREPRERHRGTLDAVLGFLARKLEEPEYPEPPPFELVVSDAFQTLGRDLKELTKTKKS